MGWRSAWFTQKTLEVHPPLLDYFTSAFAAAQEAGVCEALSNEIAKLLVSPVVTTRSDDDTSVIALSIEDVEP